MSDEGTGTPRESFLSNLKERRQAIAEGEQLVLADPRWTDPEIKVKYRPIDHPAIRAAQTRVEKAPKAKQFALEVDGNADLLIKGCKAVVAVLDGQEYSLNPSDPEGEPTRFDADLAENLGLPEGATARQVVKALFITEGDILSHGRALVEFSGYRETEADEGIAGE